jgi:hypothetical protein
MLSVPAGQDQQPKVVPYANNDRFDMSTPNLDPLDPLADDRHYRSTSDESRGDYAGAGTFLSSLLEDQSDRFNFDPGFNLDPTPNWAEPGVWNQGTFDKYLAFPVPEAPPDWMTQSFQEVGASTVHVAVPSLLTIVGPTPACHPRTEKGPFPTQVSYTTHHVPDLMIQSLNIAER